MGELKWNKEKEMGRLRERKERGMEIWINREREKRKGDMDE